MWSFMKSGSLLVKGNKMVLLRKAAITWSGVASRLRGRLIRNWRRQPWLLVAALISLVVVANTVLTLIWNNEQSKHWIAFTSFSFDSQPLHDEQLLCLAFARYTNPQRSIALFVDDVSRTTAATEFLRRHQIQVIPMELDHERVRTFQANYRHCSMNEIRYETMCFARFLFLDIYFTARRPEEVRSVAHVDLDIALLVEDKPPLPAGTDIFFIKESSSFFSRFTKRGLAGYAHYIEQFYNRDAESIMADVLKYGQELPPDRRDDWYLHHMLKDWYNISSLSGVTPKQFSDMHLTAIFSRQLSSATAASEDLRVKVMFPDPIRPPPMEYRVLVNANQMEEWTFCQYPTGGMYKLNWQLVRQTRQLAVNYSVTLPTLPHKPVWGIHFQATCKEAICRILCPHIVSADKGMIGCCAAT